MAKGKRRSASDSGGSAVGSRIGRVRDAWRRVLSHGGPEREALLIIAKGTLAATLAWFVAQDLMQAEYPAFAPFAAVLMLQVTVYQSVLQSIRFLLAVAFGVSLQGLLGFLLSPHIWTFAIVTFVALVIGRWRRLGTQGSQVVTAAFFAYTAFISITETGERVTLLGSLVMLVVLGSGIGVLVNLLIMPPIRYRSAEYGVVNLASAVRELIRDISTALSDGSDGSDESDGTADRDDSDDWWYRAESLERFAEQTHSSITSAEESLRWNPRRLLLSQEPPFGGYRTVVDRLRRVSTHLGSLTETLRRTSDDPDVPNERFLRGYGEFLGHIDEAAQLVTELDSSRLEGQARRLEEYIEQARCVCSDLSRTTEDRKRNLSEESRVYGGLLLDAERVMSEFEYIRDTLARVLERPGGDPETSEVEGGS